MSGIYRPALTTLLVAVNIPIFCVQFVSLNNKADEAGAGNQTRTDDLRFTSAPLYPTELFQHWC